MGDDAGRSRGVVLAVHHMLRAGLGRKAPRITLDPEAAEFTIGYAAGQMLAWMRSWHRLVIALDVPPERIAEIEADPELAAVADVRIAEYVDKTIAAVIIASIDEPPRSEPGTPSAPAAES